MHTYRPTTLCTRGDREINYVLLQAHSLPRPVPSNASEDAVSVRQCLYYILATIRVGSNTHKVDNAFASEEWVGPEFPLTPRAPLPNTRDNLPTKYSDPILQMTPLGFVETSADDPLRLYKDGPVYTMTIRFPATKIQSRGDNPFVRINRKVIKVIIDGESNSGGVGADNDDGGNDSRDAPDPFSRGSKVGLQAGPEEGSKETARSMVENFKGLTVAEERSGS